MFKKTILTVLGTALCLQSTLAQNITVGAVVEIFAGVMNGIVHEDHLDYLLGCMNGTEAMVTDIENAVHDFSQGDFWGISAGILDIKDFIAEVPVAAHNCGDIPQDFDKLGQFFSVFGNTTLLESRLEYNLLWYYSDIMADVGQARTYWNQSDFFDFGTAVGDALVLAVGDHSSSLPMDHTHKVANVREKVFELFQ